MDCSRGTGVHGSMDVGGDLLKMKSHVCLNLPKSRGTESSDKTGANAIQSDISLRRNRSFNIVLHRGAAQLRTVP